MSRTRLAIIGAAYLVASLTFAYHVHGDMLFWPRINLAVILPVASGVSSSLLDLIPRLNRFVRHVAVWTATWMIFGTAVAWSGPNSDGYWGWVPWMTVPMGVIMGIIQALSDPRARKRISARRKP